MESAWQVYLRRLASADPDFDYDEVSSWGAGEFDALVAAGLLTPTAPSTSVLCQHCDQAHWEEVLWPEGGGRPFIPCPGSAPVSIDPIRLQRWRADIRRLANLAAESLTLDGCVRPLPSHRVWFLGQKRVASSTPYFFLGAISPENAHIAAKEIRTEYGQVTALLLVPFPSVELNDHRKLKLVSIERVVNAHGATLHSDLGYVQDLYGDGRPQRVTSPPKGPSSALKRHRRGILKAAVERKELDGMAALSRHLGVSSTALRGMVNSDTNRYGESTLIETLKKLGCPREKWDRVPTRSRRA